MASQDCPISEADVAVLGAGVLGTSIAYWISSLYDCKTVLIDMENAAGLHASTRNTGVIHRPFYLDPVKKRVFALTASLSYSMWKKLAGTFGLPWKQVGTLNVALNETEARTIDLYKTWGAVNGVPEGELSVLDGKEVKSREPEVTCKEALLSSTDASVDFGAFTRALQALAVRQGVSFVGGARVDSAKTTAAATILSLNFRGRRAAIRSRFTINAAGGGALGLAHQLGVGGMYASLSFRGEYWVVNEPFASRVKTNVYRPPRYPQFPFLDPHIVVRANGTRQIGPNAVLVTGPYVYAGVGLTKALSLLGMPLAPKLRLLSDPDFVALLAREWRSSLSKRSMCGRVKEFVPELNSSMLKRRAVFGVRSTVVDSGGFVPEAVLLTGEQSAHVINYNSPGATGAPAYSALVVKTLRDSGLLDLLRPRRNGVHSTLWKFEDTSSLLH